MYPSKTEHSKVSARKIVGNGHAQFERGPSLEARVALQVELRITCTLKGRCYKCASIVSHTLRFK